VKFVLERFHIFLIERAVMLSVICFRFGETCSPHLFVGSNPALDVMVFEVAASIAFDQPFCGQDMKVPWQDLKCV
jgi:hypothetical protein